jgi:hypothetical protein
LVYLSAQWPQKEKPTMPVSSTVLAVGIVIWLSLTLSPLVFRRPPVQEPINVAFVGNSFTFVNDLPRFIEALGNNHNVRSNARTPIIHQDSMLHGSLSFSSLLSKGNGMTKWWHTNAAKIPDFRNGSSLLYDYGSCTIIQLLLGYDPNLSENNDNRYYNNDDGSNPCFQSVDYLEYSQYYRNNKKNTTTTKMMLGNKWDFVVLNDQSMNPAILSSRTKSIAVLQNSYAPLLLQAGAIPVLYSTHGYWRTSINMTKALNPHGQEGAAVKDVATFTSRLHRGYQLYARALRGANIPEVRIAPVGLAFLTVWEENMSLWQRLFGMDEYHPTPLGTYLIGCVIYGTIFEIEPPPSTTTQAINALFATARRLQLSGEDVALPTVEEALYLRSIAKRVTFLGHVPQSLRVYQTEEEEVYDSVSK